MLVRKMTVREAEQLARRIAFEKIRKKDYFVTPEVVDMEEKLAETLGTRVHIEPREKGGKISIEYFTHEELLALSILLRKAGENKTHKGMLDALKEEDMETVKEQAREYNVGNFFRAKVAAMKSDTIEDAKKEGLAEVMTEPEVAVDDRSTEEVKQEEKTEDLYNINNFTI
jgi:hypothetical protein